MNICTSYERRRGCGYRKAGGTYLCSGGYGRHCGALPIELSICPTCHAGIKPARGWTWVNLAALAAVRGCSKEGGCGDCPIADGRIQEVGLIWVGEKFYPTAQSFREEANVMGISRRISAIPRKFKLGETWVALAHRKAIDPPIELLPRADTSFAKAKPGIFHVFKPVAIEYVVKETDSEEKLGSLEKRGITLVKVVPVPDEKAA